MENVRSGRSLCVESPGQILPFPLPSAPSPLSPTAFPSRHTRRKKPSRFASSQKGVHYSISSWSRVTMESVQNLHMREGRDSSCGPERNQLAMFALRCSPCDGRPWGVAVMSAKNHKRQSVIAKREKLQTPNVLTTIRTLPNLTEPNLT